MYRSFSTVGLMAEALKIKLTIADRLYPLTIQAEQEEGLRKAAKRIEEMIKRFEQSYAVRDKQDVLAMCALQFAAQVEQKELDANKDLVDIEHRLQTLDQTVLEVLK
jgi:cell division protein ZapA